MCTFCNTGSLKPALSSPQPHFLVAGIQGLCFQDHGRLRQARFPNEAGCSDPWQSSSIAPQRLVILIAVSVCLIIFEVRFYIMGLHDILLRRYLPFLSLILMNNLHDWFVIIFRNHLFVWLWNTDCSISVLDVIFEVRFCLMALHDIHLRSYLPFLSLMNNLYEWFVIISRNHLFPWLWKT